MNPAFLPRALTTLLSAVLLVVSMAVAPLRAQALDKVSFGTNWFAEAEHGGFYQAVVDGTYKKYGLDVTIVPGGPNDNNRMLLTVGKIDFYMSANSLQAFDAVAQNRQAASSSTRRQPTIRSRSCCTSAAVSRIDMRRSSPARPRPTCASPSPSSRRR